MSSIARGGSAWLRILVPALAAAIGCGGGGAGGDSGDGGSRGASVREIPRLVAPTVTPSLPMSEGGTSPGPLTCPSVDDVVCGSVCCPAGTACVGGECHVAVDVQGCPAESPVACDTVVSCASGCTAFDESGHGNHLAVAAPAGFGEGRAGGGLYINRIDYGLPEQLVTAPFAGLMMDRTTVEVWIRPGQYLSQADWQAIYVGGGRMLAVAPRGISFGGCTIDTGPLRTNGTGDPLGPGLGWKLLALTVDGSNINFYLDSRPMGSCPHTGPAFGDPGQVYVGTNTSPGASFSKYHFQGAIDELRVLDVARTSDEIIADYEMARLPVIAGTRAMWRFDEGARRRCCPEGSSCAANGQCEPPPMIPACGGGGLTCEAWCCPAGSACTAGGCIADGFPSGCEVTCGDGNCCPAGYACGASGGCVLHPGTAPTSPCAAGEIAFDGGGVVRCCADPGTGYTIGFVPDNVGDLCHGCYIVAGNPDACPPNYSKCDAGQGAKCISGARSSQACSGGITCGGNSHERPGGCCSAGSTCIASGRCCDPGEVVCGDGCCDSAEACIAGTCTRARTTPCPVPCGDLCCRDGETCSGTTCVAPPGCPGGTPCGSGCCADGDRCAAPDVCERISEAPPSCPLDLPVACGGEVGCCPAGYVCPTWSGDVCRHAGPLPATSGPTGPKCSDTTACGAGQVCTGAGCCPADHPLACGTTCCLPGATCVDGACACPDGRPACNGTCCGEGMACQNGACSAICEEPHLPLTCGEYCCSTQYPCVDGDCACHGDHPVECGNGCCLAGSTCGVDGCGCPEATPVSCGDYCCAPGQQCLQCPGQSEPSCRDTPCPLNCPSGSHQSGNVCVCETPGHWLSTCPGGSKECCLNGMSCCYSMFGGPAACTPNAWCY